MPFRIVATPKGAPATGSRKIAPSKAAVFEHVHRTDDDDDLPEVAREMGAPDREIGKGAPKEGNPSSHEKHDDHLESPLYPESKPWPKVATRLPFKVR
jgi:hypothetical protein